MYKCRGILGIMCNTISIFIPEAKEFKKHPVQKSRKKVLNSLSSECCARVSTAFLLYKYAQFRPFSQISEVEEDDAGSAERKPAQFLFHDDE